MSTHCGLVNKCLAVLFPLPSSPLIPATEMIVQDDRAGHKVTEVTAAMLEAQDSVSFFYKLLNL